MKASAPVVACLVTLASAATAHFSGATADDRGFAGVWERATVVGNATFSTEGILAASARRLPDIAGRLSRRRWAGTNGASWGKSSSRLPFGGISRRPCDGGTGSGVGTDPNPDLRRRSIPMWRHSSDGRKKSPSMPSRTRLRKRTAHPMR